MDGDDNVVSDVLSCRTNPVAVRRRFEANILLHYIYVLKCTMWMLAGMEIRSVG